MTGEEADGEKAESDEQFEARLARLRTAQGKMPYGESRKREADPAPKRAGAGPPAPATETQEQNAVLAVNMTGVLALPVSFGTERLPNSALHAAVEPRPAHACPLTLAAFPHFLPRVDRG